MFVLSTPCHVPRFLTNSQGKKQQASQLLTEDTLKQTDSRLVPVNTVNKRLVSTQNSVDPLSYD